MVFGLFALIAEMELYIVVNSTANGGRAMLYIGQRATPFIAGHAGRLLLGEGRPVSTERLALLYKGIITRDPYSLSLS